MHSAAGLIGRHGGMMPLSFLSFYGLDRRIFSPRVRIHRVALGADTYRDPLGRRRSHQDHVANNGVSRVFYSFLRQ